MTVLVDTVLTIRQCIKKGYLSWEPQDLRGVRINQGTGYTVSYLQGTYIIIKD